MLSSSVQSALFLSRPPFYYNQVTTITMVVVNITIIMVLVAVTVVFVPAFVSSPRWNHQQQQLHHHRDQCTASTSSDDERCDHVAAHESSARALTANENVNNDTESGDCNFPLGLARGGAQIGIHLAPEFGRQMNTDLGPTFLALQPKRKLAKWGCF